MGSEYVKKYRQKRLLAGLCVDCGKPITEKTRCADCRSKCSVRSSIYSEKRRKNGLCQVCGKPVNVYSRYCDDHGVQHAELQRERQGNEEWRPGGKGRPPKWWTDKEKMKLGESRV